MKTSDKNKKALPSASDKKKLEQDLSDYMAKKYNETKDLIAPSLDPDFAADDFDHDDGIWSRISFDMKPEELVSYLDQYIVRQKKAKDVLATKVCTHFNRARYLSRHGGGDPADGVGLIKNNVLMIGPTGVGKTYMVKLIAAKLGVPFVKGDATKFSETGYVGGDVEDLIRELVHEADDDLELAQYGIVYIDEIDKIASSRDLLGPDVSRTGVQRALLKPMEETEVDLKTPHDPISQIQAIEKFRRTGEREKRTLNTRHILFIMSGAFGELAEIIRKRTTKSSLGFRGEICSDEPDHQYLCQVTAQDLMEFGFETEFVGRLPVSVVLEELDADDLYQILKNPNNPVIISKKRDFAAYGIDLRFEDQALKILAEEAAGMKTGARALVSVIENVLLPFETKLPGREIKRVLLTPEMVSDPQKVLDAMLAGESDPDQDQRFQAAVKAERLELLKMIAKRQTLYQQRLDEPLTPARMDLVADEYYRSGMALGLAFERVLDRLEELSAFAEGFYHRYSLEISFDQDAEVAVLQGAATERVSVGEFLQRLSQVLEPGLRLARDRTGQSKFLLTGQAILDPDAYLHGLFQDHYQNTLGEIQ